MRISLFAATAVMTISAVGAFAATLDRPAAAPSQVGVPYAGVNAPVSRGSSQMSGQDDMARAYELGVEESRREGSVGGEGN